MLLCAVRHVLISLAACVILASCEDVAAPKASGYAPPHSGNEAAVPPSSSVASLTGQASDDEALLQYLASLEDHSSPGAASAAPGEDMLNFVDLAGFARFCGFTPERRSFFESLAYVRVTPETYDKFRNEFKSECAVRLLRREPRDWILVGPTAADTDGQPRQIRTLSGHGIRLTLALAQLNTPAASLATVGS